MRWIKRVLWIILMILRGTLRLMLYGLRMAVWLILCKLRGLVQMLCGLMMIAGLGLTITFLLSCVGVIGYNSDDPFWFLALVGGFGFLMTIAGSFAIVFYDALLFKLQPKDREIIYF